MLTARIASHIYVCIDVSMGMCVCCGLIRLVVREVSNTSGKSLYIQNKLREFHLTNYNTANIIYNTNIYIYITHICIVIFYI